MKQWYRLLTIPLLFSPLFIGGCSLHDAKAPKDAGAQNTPHKPERKDSAEKVVQQNTKLATEIAAIEKKIALLEKEITQTSPGVDRAKIVKKKSVLEEKVAMLRSKQVENAKKFKESEHEKDKQNAKATAETSAADTASVENSFEKLSGIQELNVSNHVVKVNHKEQ